MAPARREKDSNGWTTVKPKPGHRKAIEAEQDGRTFPGSNTKAESDSFTDSASTRASMEFSRSASPIGGGEDRRPRRAKKQKTAPSDVPIDAQQIASAVADALDYSDDAMTQIGLVTDFLITHYRDSELAFNKVVLEQSVEKAVDVPLVHVPKEAVQQALRFYRQQDARLLADAAMRLIKALFADLPVSAKAAPPRAKVGLLVSLSLMLRATPGLALLLADGLLRGGAEYSSPLRMPFLLWTLGQAAKGDAAVGVALWARVLLPQLLGCPLPSPGSSPSAAPPPRLGREAAERALQFLDGILAREKPAVEPPERDERGHTKWHPGTVGAGIPEGPLVKAARRGIRMPGGDGHDGKAGKQAAVLPVVPPGALAAIAARSHGRGGAGLAAAQRARLHSQAEVLRELALAGCQGGGFSAAEAVELLLQAAGAAQQGDEEVLEGAAREIISCLVADPAGARAGWEAALARQLRGSRRVLQHLAGSFPGQAGPLLGSTADRSAFASLLQALQGMHTSVPATSKEAAADACAADEACARLQALLSASSSAAFKPGSARSMLGALAAATAVVAIAAVQTEPGRAVMGELAGSRFVSAANSTMLRAAQQLQPLLFGLAHEAVVLADAAHTKAQPLLHQLADALGEAAAYAMEHAVTVQQALSSRMHELRWPGSS